MSDIVPPCDCVELVDGNYISRCCCSNRDDGERAAAWCVEANHKAAADYDRCTIEFLRKEAAEQADEIDAIVRAIPEHFLLDPPDGGDVTVAEGVQRMAARIEQLEAALLGEETEHSRRIMEVDRLRAALRAVIRYAGNAGDDYLANEARAALGEEP